MTSCVPFQDEDEGVDTGDDDCFYGRALARPPEQLELTEAVTRLVLIVVASIPWSRVTCAV